MKNPRKLKLVVVGTMLLLALHYPIISFFSFEKLVFGIPQLFFYLFSLWVVLIIVIIKLTTDIKHSNLDREDE